MVMNFNKIGVDFHNVINRQPEFFKQLFDLAHERGIKVYIISGGPHDMIADFLASHSMKYDVLWCIFDYFNARKAVTFLADGSFYVDDIAWNRAKADYCRQHNIDLQIDDSPIYGKYFTTPYCRYDYQTQTGVLADQTLDFSRPAAEVLQELICICTSQTSKHGQ